MKKILKPHRPFKGYIRKRKYKIYFIFYKNSVIDVKTLNYKSVKTLDMIKYEENELLYKNNKEITIKILLASALKNEYAGLMNLKEKTEGNKIPNLLLEKE